MEESKRIKVGGEKKVKRTNAALPMITGFRSHFVQIAFASLAVLLFSFTVHAQDQIDAAPPPIKMLSKSEKADLSSRTEPKQRTELALDLMNKRLISAEKYRTDENYSLMYAELGGFHALMDDTIQFLLRSTVREGKQLNSLKRFEIGLRSFTTRLEIVRRDLPSNFDPYLKTLLKNIDDTREKAMAPFFSDTVISNLPK